MTSGEDSGSSASIGIYKEGRVYLKKIKYACSSNSIITKEQLLQIKQVSYRKYLASLITDLCENCFEDLTRTRIFSQFQCNMPLINAYQPKPTSATSPYKKLGNVSWF